MTLIQPIPVPTTPAQPAAAQQEPVRREIHEDDLHPLDVAIVTLPTLVPDDNPPPQSSYPKPWQDFLNHLQDYILNHIAFIHPFPSGYYLQSSIRENAAMAFSTFRRTYQDYVLSKRSCKFELSLSSLFSLIFAPVDEHRSNLITLVRLLFISTLNQLMSLLRL